MHRRRAGGSGIIRTPSARSICLCLISLAFSCSSYKYKKTTLCSYLNSLGSIFIAFFYTHTGKHAASSSRPRGPVGDWIGISPRSPSLVRECVLCSIAGRIVAQVFPIEATSNDEDYRSTRATMATSFARSTMGSEQSPAARIVTSRACTRTESTSLHYTIPWPLG